MKYVRMPIEIEAPEGFGYDKIDCNLSESSVTDQRLGDLSIDLRDLVLMYGDHLGKPELRELIGSQAGLQADQVLVTSGAATALFIIATSMLDNGDHLVVMRSNYATNIETPRAIGADISFLELSFDKAFSFELSELEALITDNTKLVSLTYPHNPTGVMISEEKLRAIVNLVEKKGSYLLMDETYREMSFAPKLPVAANLSDRVISVSSMSKAYGLPGIRIGWILCRNQALMNLFLAAKEQICITNSVVDEEIAYRYLLKKLEHFTPIKHAIQKNFAIVKKFMDGQDMLEWIEPQGGCVCFPRIKKNIVVDADRFHEILLNNYATYVGRGHWFEQDARYMRIGYGWDKSTKLEKGLKNILKAIGDALED